MYRHVSNTLFKIQEKRDLIIDLIEVDYSETTSSRSLSLRSAFTGPLESGRGGGGGGREGGAILTTKTFHGLLGQKEVALLDVTTTAIC